MPTKKYIWIFSLLLLMPAASQGQSQQFKNSVNGTYEYYFVENISDWNLGQFWYERKFTNLAVQFNFQYANRFNDNAYLTEIDLYPIFNDKLNAHFNIGAALSRNDLFPNFKAGATVFRNLSSTWVGGAGLDYQSFKVDDILIYNTHLQWYIKDFLVMGQGLLQVRDNTPLGTGILTIRKYSTDVSYIYLKGAYGQAPQNLRFEQDVLNSYQSYFFSMGIKQEISNKFILRSSVSYRQSIFSEVTARSRIGISVGFGYRF